MNTIVIEKRSLLDFGENGVGKGEAKDFYQLTLEEQKLHFTQVATRALPLWGYPEQAKLKLLNITENATYLVEHPGLESIIMRVHRLIYAQKDSIRTELSWIEDLSESTDLSVPMPIKALNGEYVQTITTPELEEERNVVCFTYMKGKAPRDSQDDIESVGKIIAVMSKMPKAITVPLFRFASVLTDKMDNMIPSSDSKLTNEDMAMYHKLGEIAAKIHQQSKKWSPPEFYERIEWNWKATFDRKWNNFYGAHYGDIEGILSAKDIAIIDRCAALIKERLAVYGKAPDRYGMIHSDLRMANLLKDENEISVLDFDDCGKGWYMYDIAGIVGFLEQRADLQSVIEVIVNGYRTISDLSVEDEQEIPTFIMMRRIGLLQAIIYHLDNTDVGSGESSELSPEILAYYAKGTVILAKKYLKRFE